MNRKIVERWTDSQINKQCKGRQRQMDKWPHRNTYRKRDRLYVDTYHREYVDTPYILAQGVRQIERQADGQIEGQIDGHTSIHTDRQVDKQEERNKNRDDREQA